MAKSNTEKVNRYGRIIEHAFLKNHKEGDQETLVTRDEFVAACKQLKINAPKNIGDVPYTFRYRGDLPAKVVKAAPKGKHWIIMPAGKGIYRFEAVKHPFPSPSINRAVVKIYDATPVILVANALQDEQARLATLRHNRLIDIFLRLTCYSLQNHMRTTVKNMGQIEVDELYLGVDKQGAQYVIPVQAKGARTGTVPCRFDKTWRYVLKGSRNSLVGPLVRSS